MSGIGGDTRGAAGLEFGLLAPVLLLLMLGLIDLARVAAARGRLEQATGRAARLVAATDCPNQREAVLSATIRASMSDILGADAKPKLESKAYADRFGQVGEPEPFVDDPSVPNGRFDPGEGFTDVNGNGKWDADMGRSGSIGGAGQVVSYTATIEVRSLFPFLADIVTGRDSFPIRAETVIRNEPIFRSTGC